MTSIAFEERSEVILNHRLKNTRVINPDIVGILKHGNMGFSSTNNRGKIKESGIFIPMSDPFNTRFLIPVNFPLSQNIVILRNKIFL